MRNLNVLFFFLCLGCAASSSVQRESDRGYGHVGEPFGHVEVTHDEPVQACLTVPAASPEEHLESWWTMLREQDRRQRSAGYDPTLGAESFAVSYVSSGRALVEAMPRAIASGDQRAICRALFVARNIACTMCQMQSLQTRAILRCYLDELSSACPDGTETQFPTQAVEARRCLYERGCYEPQDGWYRP